MCGCDKTLEFTNLLVRDQEVSGSVKLWSNLGAVQGCLAVRKRRRRNDLRFDRVALEGRRSFATELQAHPWLLIGSTVLSIPVRVPIIPDFLKHSGA